MSDLITCQNVVESMSTNGGTLAEIEEYIERCALDEMEKAGLWMLAWAQQDQATQLRLAKETLALLRSMHPTTPPRIRWLPSHRQAAPALVSRMSRP